MKKSEKQAIAAIVIIAILFVGAMQYGLLKQFGIPPFSTAGNGGNGGNQPITDTMKEDYLNGIGKYQLDVKAFDSLDPGTPRTLATNLDVFFYHFVGGQWSPDSGAYDPAATNYYTSKPADNGIAYVVVKAKSAQAFYVDYQKMQQGDSYIMGHQYVDVDMDGQRDFVFQYNLKNHQIPSSGYPVISFVVDLITYDGSFTGVANLSNITGVGTSTNTTYFEWYLSFSAEKKGIAIYKIVLDINATSETQMRFKNMQIPGLGTLDKSQFTYDAVSDTEMKYSYTISNNFDGALYLSRLPQSSNKYYMTTQIDWTMASSAASGVKLTVYYLIAPTEAGASKFDDFYANE